MELQSLTEGLKSVDVTSKTIWAIWLLSALGYVARGLPTVIGSALKQWFTTTLFAIDDGVNIRTEFFVALEKFIASHHNPSNSNTITFRIINGVKQHSPGPGWGWFFMHGTLIVFKKIVETQTTGTWHGNTQTISLRIFTKNKDKLDVILDHVHRDAPHRTFNAYQTDKDWRELSVIRDTREIFLDPQLKATIDKAVDFFRDNKQWYLDRGLPWKLTIMLHGIPGTGKTSVTRYIADRLNVSIYQTTLTAMSSDMRSAVLSVPEMGVLSLEDFDDCSGIHDRTKSKETVTETKSGFKVTEGLLTQFLNTFQGLVPLHGQVTVLTTNHPEKIDKAAIREGRVDLCLEVGLMQPQQISEFVQKNFGVASPQECGPYTAAHVANCYSNNPNSLEDFFSALNAKANVCTQ